MANIINTPVKRIQARILGAVRPLDSLERCSVTVENNNEVIWVKSEFQYVPNLKFEWDYGKSRYRLYFYMACGDNPEKVKAGYALCVVPNGLVAAAIAVFYQLLNKYRPRQMSA